MESSPPSNYTSPYSLSTNGFNSQAQTLILSVIHFFKRAKRNPSLLKGSPRFLASRALSVSESALTRIVRKEKTGKEIMSPIRKKPIAKHKMDLFDTFDIQSVRNIIKSFYANK